MPSDCVIEAPTKSWSALLRAVTDARAAQQSEEDTWCVVGVNGAHILTVWSKPHEPGKVGVRPSNHAEERLVTVYPKDFEAGYRAVAGTTNLVTIFLKKSPCNFGTGSCYDMFRRFLLDYRSDHSDSNAVEVVYDQRYGGYGGRYIESSQQAINEFNGIRGCNMITWGMWYRGYQDRQAPPVPQSVPQGASTSGPVAPKPVILPSLKAEAEAGIKPVGGSFITLGKTDKSLDQSGTKEKG